MFADELSRLNDLKVEASSELSRKSLANFVNLRRSSKNARKTFVWSSGNTRKIVGLEIAKSWSKLQKVARKLLEKKKVAQKMKNCLKAAEHVWYSPSLLQAVSLYLKRRTQSILAVNRPFQLRLFVVPFQTTRCYPWKLSPSNSNKFTWKWMNNFQIDISVLLQSKSVKRSFLSYVCKLSISDHVLLSRELFFFFYLGVGGGGWWELRGEGQAKNMASKRGYAKNAL